jgi:RES domain-containing protein
LSFRFTGVCYRAIDPRWQMLPTSGDGAAIRGARFNPKGVPALYLSTSANGAIAEATQGFAHKFHPLTLCSFDVDCADIIDLSTDAARAEAGVTLKDTACAWMDDISSGRRPASWSAHARFGKGAAGVLVPSFAHGAAAGNTNLALWKWGAELPHRVEVFDPQGRLVQDLPAA